MHRAGAASRRCSQAAAADCVIPAQQVGLPVSTHALLLPHRTMLAAGPHPLVSRSVGCATPNLRLCSSCSCRSCFCKLLERLHLLDALWKASNPGPTPGAQADQQLGPAEIVPDASQVSSTREADVCPSAWLPGMGH